jgi:hypothetical protein
MGRSMKIENQVCSPEQAKELAERGVKIKTVFRHGFWVDESYNTIFHSSEPKGYGFFNGYTFFPAPTVAELGVLLPCYIEVESIGPGDDGKRYFSSFRDDEGFRSEFANEYTSDLYATEAQARAAALIWLLDNKYIKQEDLKL